MVFPGNIDEKRRGREEGGGRGKTREEGNREEIRERGRGMKEKQEGEEEE